MKKLVLSFTALMLVCCLFSSNKAMAKEVEYNVKSEGAQGDGVTDDVKAINAVILEPKK